MKINYLYIILAFFLSFSACHTAEKAVVKPTEIEKVPDLAALGDSVYFYGKIAGKTVFLKENNPLYRVSTYNYYGYPPLTPDSSLITSTTLSKHDVIKNPLSVRTMIYRPLRVARGFNLFQSDFRLGKQTFTQENPFSYPNFTIGVIYMDNSVYKNGYAYAQDGKEATLEILAVKPLVLERGVPDVMVKFRFKGSLWDSIDPKREKGKYLGEVEGIYQAHFRYQWVDIDYLLKLNSGK